MKSMGDSLDPSSPMFLERLMDHLLVRATDPIICVVPDGSIIWCNEATRRALGWSRDELSRMQVSDVDSSWTPDAWQSWVQEFRTNGCLTVRTSLRRRDGSTFPAELHVDRMDFGEHEVAFTTVRDITDSQETQERLRRQVEELDERRRFNENMLNTSPDILWVYDLKDRRNIYLSRQFERVMGYSAREVMAMEGQVLPRLVHPDDYVYYLENVLAKYLLLADGEVLPLRFRVRHRNGSWRILQAREVIHARNPDGTPRQVFGLARDVTDERVTEIRYRTILRTSIDGVWIFALDGSMIEINDAYCEMSGYSRDELLAMGIHDLEARETSDETDAHIALLQQTGHDRFETRHRRKDGSVMDIEVSVKAIPGSGGMCAAFIRDITERKQAEAAERRLREELERSSREMEQMLYVASHDLRSPLLSVQGFGSLLELDLAALAKTLALLPMPDGLRIEIDRILGEVAPEALGFIGKGVMRMDSLLTGLLKVSRAGRVVAAPKDLDMGRLVADVTSSLEFQIRKKGVALSVGPLPPCRGDPAMTAQVLGNLLDNALKYLDPGRPGRISVRGAHLDGQPTYTIEDNGIGIAPEHAHKVFEMFHRLDPDAGTGEGIGLTIVRTLVDRQGGRVWLESRPGEGSCFHISMPPAIHDIERFEGAAGI